MKVYYKEKVRDIKLSLNIKSNSEYEIFNNTVKIYKKNSNDILAIFIKGAIKDQKLLKAGRNLLRYKMASNSRGNAAGVNSENRKKYNNGSMGTANSVMSSVVGYMENNGMWPCRQTNLYKKYEHDFDTETIKLIQFISKEFKRYCPSLYNNQKKFTNSINKNMVFKNTVYTTITVNCDWRTRTHTDKGDYPYGLGNLAVFDYTKSDLYKGNIKNPHQNWSGGEFLIPEYEIGFNMNEGDLLFVDVHAIHCNNPIKGKGRVSLVCYAREKILDRCRDLSKDNLSNWNAK
jgi:hypothetical protein